MSGKPGATRAAVGFHAVLASLRADPAAAFAETRRVLRPGGRVALAVWADMSANPWALMPAQELISRGLAPPPGKDPRPGPFTLGSAERVRELLQQAGFSEVVVQELELTRSDGSFEELWETTLDMSRNFHDAVFERPPQEVQEIRSSLQERFAPYTEQDGSLRIPARTLVASAGA